MNTVYFGEKGITSSSCNHLCNLAKEECKKYESKLRNLSFVNKYASLINGDTRVLHKGNTEDIVNNLKNYLESIANFHSFCAWGREALKEKQNALDKLGAMTYTQYAKNQEIELPVYPEAPKKITEQDVIDQMNIKERNSYLRLEAFSSVFGQNVHPDGNISDARDTLLDRIENPTELDGKGRDLIIYSYDPSVNVDLVNDVYMKLQNEYRNYEKNLNSLKYQIKEQVNQHNHKAQTEYNKAHDEYTDKINSIKNEFDAWQIEERERISSLKIVIPERLQKTYEYLESLGK